MRAMINLFNYYPDPDIELRTSLRSGVALMTHKL